MKIRFVCIKNASRSLMAEALLKLSSKRGIQVYSAGIKPGKEVNEQAVKAMREIGCDLSGHEPRHISAFSDIKFDYVAKMDVLDLGDMVTAKWIADWDIPTPCRVASPNTARSPNDRRQNPSGVAAALNPAAEDATAQAISKMAGRACHGNIAKVVLSVAVEGRPSPAEFTTSKVPRGDEHSSERRSHGHHSIDHLNPPLDRRATDLAL